MKSNKFSKLFNSNDESSHLSYIYFSYCDKVKQDEREDLYIAYTNASQIALKRELKEAERGIFR